MHFTHQQKYKNRTALLIVLALTVCPLNRVFASAEPLVIEIRVTGLHIDTLAVGDQIYHRVTFSESDYWGNPGDPMIPCRTLAVPLPGLAGPRVTVIPLQTEILRGIRLQPVPVMEPGDPFPRERLMEGPNYQAPDFLPGTLYETEVPGMSGRQAMTRIRVFPVQYHPQDRTLRIIRALTVRIEFDEAPEAPPFRDAMRSRPSPASPERRLASAVILKIPVEKEGLYKITGRLLEANGVSLASIDPATLKIANNGGRPLPWSPSDARPDSLIENPVQTVGMDDQTFDRDDYILFYGRGTRQWHYDPSAGRFAHSLHPYTEKNIYWLIFNDGRPGKRMTGGPASPGPSAQSIATHRGLLFVEEELNNPDKGGLNWYGPLLDNSVTKSYPLNFHDFVSGDSPRFYFRYKGASAGTHQITARLSGTDISAAQFSGTGFSAGSAVLQPLSAGSGTLVFHYSGVGTAPRAFIDWFEIHYTRTLRPAGGALAFFSPVSAGSYDFRLQGFQSEPVVLDVTDPAQIRIMSPRLENGDWFFADAFAGGPRYYYASLEKDAIEPESLLSGRIAGLREPGNGADMIIISHGDFLEESLRLKTHRETHDTLQVTVVDIETVYDEFAWGLQDPAAIRDFIRHAFHYWTPAPRYVLLMGNGHYDYRNLSTSLPNYIVPFEYDGTGNDGARASDDWYTYVSPYSVFDSYMDVSIGRLPVRSGAQARAMVDKIIAYESRPEHGDWKKAVTIVGDDEKADAWSQNEVIHIRASETVAESVIPPLFNLEKIYLTEYPEELTSQGRRKPLANKALLDRINRGTLLINYIGHGNARLWAHEWVFHRDIDFQHVKNESRLPLIYAATCSFGWYDDPEESSFSEVLLNTAGRGAVAVIAANRLCNARYNEILNRIFLDSLFQDPARIRLGDALREAKNSTSFRVNNEMYHLLGDPAMRLAAPRHEAVFTQVPDTLKALSIVTLKGLLQKNGTPWPAFSGHVMLRVFDSKKEVVYKTAAGTSLEYLLAGNAIFRGTAEADGSFEISFVVPKDVSYGGDTGRLSCYFYDGLEDGAGFQSDLVISGSGSIVDTDPPYIDLTFDGYDFFVPGSMIDENPVLKASIGDDSSGINITGEIGHKIILTVNGNSSDVTDYFEYNQGSYLEGALTYPIYGLDEGDYVLSLKAWDNANNSTVETLPFRVVSSGKLRLERVMNYPNPFDDRTGTDFTFLVSQEAEIEIKIYTVDGRLIKRLSHIPAQPGFNQVSWNGRDEQGDRLANGVYLYKIIARTRSGSRSLQKEALERLMIMR